jgi:succinylglutamate desuccinylase
LNRRGTVVVFHGNEISQIQLFDKLSTFGGERETTFDFQILEIIGSERFFGHCRYMEVTISRSMSPRFPAKTGAILELDSAVAAATILAPTRFQ